MFFFCLFVDWCAVYRLELHAFVHIKRCVYIMFLIYINEFSMWSTLCSCYGGWYYYYYCCCCWLVDSVGIHYSLFIVVVACIQQYKTKLKHSKKSCKQKRRGTDTYENVSCFLYNIYSSATNIRSHKALWKWQCTDKASRCIFHYLFFLFFFVISSIGW